ncbi:MAG: hypothetical protein EPO23_03440 [Xanthobacteraceae bacterium]|nr:MAG: hypothetical protein EPO23_03440 [Xanthobacteraceae bacterium]
MTRLPPIATRGGIRASLLDEVERLLPRAGGIASSSIGDVITSHTRSTVRAALLQLRREGRADFEGPMGARLWRSLPQAAPSIVPKQDANLHLEHERVPA